MLTSIKRVTNLEQINVYYKSINKEATNKSRHHNDLNNSEELNIVVLLLIQVKFHESNNYLIMLFFLSFLSFLNHKIILLILIISCVAEPLSEK
jgi:hypothetical protein